MPTETLSSNMDNDNIIASSSSSSGSNPQWDFASRTEGRTLSATPSVSSLQKATVDDPSASETPMTPHNKATTTTTNDDETFLSNNISTTAYSFAGSALGRDATEDLNEKRDMPSGGETKTTPNSTNNNNNDDEKVDDSMYECNICLDTAKDAVVSMCGHLFCWPCLHQWLETRPNRKLCPVCKSAIGKDKVIPLYGRNSTKQEDPRNKVPPRPAGQRMEPEPQQGFQAFGFGDGFHMSFGIGAFPFGFFASSLNFGEQRPAAANRGTTQYNSEQQLSKMFLYLAFMCIAWLVFA